MKKDCPRVLKNYQGVANRCSCKLIIECFHETFFNREIVTISGLCFNITENGFPNGSHMEQSLILGPESLIN